MAEIVTEKPVNPTQLGVELGRVALRVIGPKSDGSYVVKTDAVTEPDLQAAIDAHVADDDYVDPERVPPPDPMAELDAAVDAVDTSAIVDVSAKQAIEDLKAAIKGTAGHDGRADARVVQ